MHHPEIPVPDNGIGIDPPGMDTSITWTRRPSAEENGLKSVWWTPRGALFIAIEGSKDSRRVVPAPDGVTWTARSGESPVSDSINSYRGEAAMHYPVPLALVNSVSLKPLCTLLDALHYIQTTDMYHDKRIREAESRLEELFGAYCSQPRRGTIILDPTQRFGSTLGAYRTAESELSVAFAWYRDDEGPGWNRWVDLESILERGARRLLKGGDQLTLEL